MGAGRTILGGPSTSEAGLLPRLDSYKLQAEQSVGSCCKNINKATFLKHRLLRVTPPHLPSITVPPHTHTLPFESLGFLEQLRKDSYGLQNRSPECLNHTDEASPTSKHRKVVKHGEPLSEGDLSGPWERKVWVGSKVASGTKMQSCRSAGDLKKVLRTEGSRFASEGTALLHSQDQAAA